MTEWNPNDPYDLGIWDELGESSPASETEDLLPLKRTKTARKLIANKKSKQEACLRRVVKGKRGSSRALKRAFSHTKNLFAPKTRRLTLRWAVKNFGEWQTAYNFRHPEKVCPAGILLSDDSKELSWWLQKYAVSTRKTNGDKYPPKTVYLLLCGLQRHMRERKQHPFNLFDKEHPDFKLLVTTCDNYFRELRADGVGAESQPTEPFTVEDEEKLWNTAVL